MNRVQSFFLNLFCAAVFSRPATDPGCSENEWTDLFRIAHEQSVLPMLYEVCFRFDSFQRIQAEVRRPWKEQALQTAVRQITQTNEFLTLILHSQDQGLDPVVLKGIVCRSMYPKPYLRPSVDEDILVRPEEMKMFHQFLVSEGLFPDDPDTDPKTASEISYHKKDSPIYIELHKDLFGSEGGNPGDWNELFDRLLDRAVCVQIEDVSVRTLAPTDHFLYLILHAFKHFIHSGVGIRPVCDIGLFAEHYVDEIDWERIRVRLSAVHAFDFARALFRIVQQYLLTDAALFERIEDWQTEEIDTEPLLKDILTGGVHGNASMERLHSSNITLNAVNTDKKRTGLIDAAIYSIFLPIERMSSQYPYLKKVPVLLPFAWGQRLIGYLRERRAVRFGHRDSHGLSAGDKRGGAAESIRLGQSRVELLKKYGIIR